MQYTLRNIPADLDRVLRLRAGQTGQSMNEVIIAALLRDCDLSAMPGRRRSLAELAGIWREDPEFEKMIRDQDSIDPQIWESEVRPMTPRTQTRHIV